MGFLDFFKVKLFKEQISSLEQRNLSLSNQLNEANEKLKNWGVFTYEDIQAQINSLSSDYEQKKKTLEHQLQVEISSLENEASKKRDYMTELDTKISDCSEELQKTEKQSLTATRKLNRVRELYKAIEYSLDTYLNLKPTETQIRLSTLNLESLDEYSPSIYLKLHCMDVKDLRKAYRENDKQISKILEQYASRYTTKANQSIYQLMVIALRSELQNILYNLKYEKLEQSISLVKNMTAKYLKIAGEGNQSISGTLSKFIGEIEYLFINAVKIEYNYYVKKEQARQEQLAIREQMKQEAEERKALETEKKKIEKEEEKFKSQISNLSVQVTSAQGDELAALQARILELQAQLSNVVLKKDEISSLQNGKAGNVYIISNLGSFGDNVFKIGMTRRLDPQDRINELGNASVPFKFDVHSFIFSDDAVSLENELHKRLNNRRVNKVNLRKEFFHITLDELETLVAEICPTAEFNRTMLAEEFYQSQATSESYSSDFTYDVDDDE